MTHPSMYSLPGYFMVTVWSFWVPTLLFAVVLGVVSRSPVMRGKGVTAVGAMLLGLLVVMQIAGWVTDSIALHSWSQTIALYGVLGWAVWMVRITINERRKRSS